MSPVSAVVLLAVIWFVTLFVVLPLRLETQGDVGEKIAGTPDGAPSSSFSMKRKLWIITMVAIPIWVVICAVIIWGGISVRDIDFFNRMGG
jgi:predicted secreted protein